MFLVYEACKQQDQQEIDKTYGQFGRHRKTRDVNGDLVDDTAEERLRIFRFENSAPKQVEVAASSQ